MKDSVRLGFELGTGADVSVPIRHLCVTGATQESGKTTTLEALIRRSGRRALAFRTKRAEGAFDGAEVRALRPYFRERADWQFVAAILEATLRERLKFQRPWIMKVCRGTKTLADVQRGVRKALENARGLTESVYTELDAYLDIVVPQIERVSFAESIALKPGINVMDLTDYTAEMQALVIRSAIEWVYERERDTVTIIPEAWEFLPQARSSPVLLAAEQLVRKGAASGNYLWIDSQDIAGVNKVILRSVAVWILGVQREVNEIKRTLGHVHGVDKPKVTDIAHLERGQFVACFGHEVRKTYVQPAWLGDEEALRVALGQTETKSRPAKKGEPAVNEREATELRRRNTELETEVRQLKSELADLRGERAKSAARASKATPETAAPAATQNGSLDYESIKRRLFEDAKNDPALLRLLTSRPEIEVHVKRETITLEGNGGEGWIARLISEGFFDSYKTASAAYEEMRSRGAPGSKPTVYGWCDALLKRGFLTKHSSHGYRAVPGMKVNIIES